MTNVKQVVVQYTQDAFGFGGQIRMIVQNDDGTQKITNYADLPAGEQTKWNDFKTGVVDLHKT